MPQETWPSTGEFKSSRSDPAIGGSVLTVSTTSKSINTAILTPVNGSGIPYANPARFTVKVWLTTTKDNSIPASALIDSGAEGNFVDADFARKHDLPITQKKDTSEIKGIDGRTLASGLVTKETRVNITCQSGGSGFHAESSLQLEIIQSPTHVIILGLPWLRLHQPSIDWQSLSMTFDSEYCKKHCQDSAIQPTQVSRKPDAVNQEMVGNLPPEFMDFKDVFSESNANTLPPHRKHDCAIDLLPGTKPPVSQIYPLSQDEDRLLVEYLEENLKKGFIQKSKSSAGAPIFFVEKEDKALRENRVPQKRLVVNYKGLDKITEKFVYPLPLITEIFDRLGSARIFTKIDLFIGL